jgi:four helix bundle protein
MGDYKELKARTKRFALSIVRFYTSLPKAAEAQVLGKQLLRSGTSVGAHYHEACRARSKAEFISKLVVAQQELDETIYWLDLLTEAEIAAKAQVAMLIKESDELMAIFGATVLTTRRSATGQQRNET